MTASIMQFIVIEGEISAGKTELSHALHDAFARAGVRAYVIPEPVEKWREVGILQEFYSNPAAYGYVFQTFAYATRVMSIIAAVRDHPECRIFIMDRSPATDPIFMTLLEGVVRPRETEMYAVWCEAYKCALPPAFADAVVLYLRTDLPVCMTRLASRGRAEELSENSDEKTAKGGVSLGYQERLRRAHEALLFGLHRDEFPRLDSPFKPERVIAVERELANGDFKNPGPEQDRIIGEVMKKIAAVCTIDNGLSS